MREEAAEAGKDVDHSAAHAAKDLRSGFRPIGDEEDQERNGSPRQNLLDHDSPPFNVQTNQYYYSRA